MVGARLEVEDGVELEDVVHRGRGGVLRPGVVEGIVAAGADQHVGTAEPFDEVVPCAAVDVVGVRVADQVVAGVVADQVLEPGGDGGRARAYRLGRALPGEAERDRAGDALKR